MRRPVIGLTTYAEQARFGHNDSFAAVLPMTYVRAVHAGGGRAVLITEDDPGADVLDGLDGLILSGGGDVAPQRYGEVPHEATVSRPERDTAELILLRAALDADLPVLAICRGMQVMAVAAGGRLYQHLPDRLGHDGHRPPQGSPETFGRHEVTLAPGSRCHALLGPSVVTNSYHHQGVADAGTLTETGWVAEPALPGGRLVETVEDPDRRFAIGVQWHPEASDDLRLFEALAHAAAGARV